MTRAHMTESFNHFESNAKLLPLTQGTQDKYYIPEFFEQKNVRRFIILDTEWTWFHFTP